MKEKLVICVITQIDTNEFYIFGLLKNSKIVVTSIYKIQKDKMRIVRHYSKIMKGGKNA